MAVSAVKIIQTLYPFLQSELFLKWRSEVLQNMIEQMISSLVKVELDDVADTIYTTAPNSEVFNQLLVSAGYTC